MLMACRNKPAPASTLRACLNLAMSSTDNANRRHLSILYGAISLLCSTCIGIMLFAPIFGIAGILQGRMECRAAPRNGYRRETARTGTKMSIGGIVFSVGLFCYGNLYGPA